MQKAGNTAVFHVEGIGGIDETTVEISPGVTVLAGRNATNRTSFLQAIKAAMGSRDVSIKGDVDEATVRLQIDEKQWERTLQRDGSTVVSSGEAPLDDPEIAELFAFLLENNEARQAVIQSRDLHDLIMRPIDTAEIEAEIERRLEDRTEIEDRLAELNELKEELPENEQERERIDSAIEEKRQELQEVETEISESEADVEATQEGKAELEEKLAELRDVRNELEEVRYDIDTQKQSISSFQTERTELQTELEELESSPADGLTELESEIDQLRTEKRRLETRAKDLRSVLQFNQEILDGRGEVAETDLSGSNDGDLTDQLLDDDGMVSCWTCGSTVPREQIEETLDELRSLHQQKQAEISDIEDRLTDLREEKQEIERRERRRSELERKVEETESEIERREERLESLTEKREELSETVEVLENEVDELESEDFDDILALHKEANQLEFDIERLEKELASIEERIEGIEDQLKEEDRLERRREEITAELTDLRNRIDQIENQAVEEFNHHMEALLSLLGYENIERIWIEQYQREVRDGRQKVERSVFELHVVRTTENGTTYEDTVDHLSESEREVTGLVFALAGYLVHDVHEKVPFMLLDSLEAIDSDRIAILIDYFKEFAEYLVVALLPEDAQALDDDYQRVTEI